MPIDGFDHVKHVNAEVSPVSHFHHLDRKLLLGQPQVKAEVRKDLPDHLLASSLARDCFPQLGNMYHQQQHTTVQFSYVACKKRTQITDSQGDYQLLSKEALL